MIGDKIRGYFTGIPVFNIYPMKTWECCIWCVIQMAWGRSFSNDQLRRRVLMNISRNSVQIFSFSKSEVFWGSQRERKKCFFARLIFGSVSLLDCHESIASNPLNKRLSFSIEKLRSVWSLMPKDFMFNAVCAWDEWKKFYRVNLCILSTDSNKYFMERPKQGYFS